MSRSSSSDLGPRPTSSNLACWEDDKLRSGDDEALITPDRSWSEQELRDQSCRLASALIERGVEPGDRVLVVLPTSRETLVAATAIWRSGGVLVAIYSGTPANEVERIAAHCSPIAIVTSADLAAATVASRVARITILTGDAPPLSPGCVRFDDEIARSAPLPRPLPRTASDIAQLLYTSGTTGTPKAVVYTHGTLDGAIRHDVTLENLAFRFVPRPTRSRDTLLFCLSPTAFGDLVLKLRLASRTRLLLLERFEPAAVLAAIERHRVTRLVLVPSMSEALLASSQRADHDLSSITEIMMAGAYVSASLLRRVEDWLGVRPFVTYGLTEAGVLTATEPRSPDDSVGRALPGVELKVVDDGGRELPPGQVGEICVRTPWMAAGYLRAPADTAATFCDGWVRTGDRGELSAVGELVFAGRSKEIVIQGGVNVAPHEVAEVIASVPGVAECAVVGLPHVWLGEEVVACVVRRPGATVTEQEILARCRAEMDERKLPGQVRFRDSLPRTATGKLQTHVLREQLATELSADGGVALAARLGPLEPGQRRRALGEVVIAELRKLLEDSGHPAPAIDLDRSFGELDLRSVDAVRFTRALGALIGQNLAPTLTFAFPTVGQVTDHLLSLLVSEPREQTPVAPAVEPGEPRDHIAVIGIGCRFPGGADTPEQFWQLVAGGVDAVGDPPVERWSGQPGSDDSPAGGFVGRIDEFDARFFRLTYDAEAVDPQQRMVLEVAWEALSDAGWTRRSFGDADQVGVFLGISPSAYGLPGAISSALSMAVGQVCHFFDFRGPAVTIDTACSSSLVAVHHAVQGLRRGECDVALAGGVNVIVTPAATAHLSALGVLSPDGRSKAFAAGADGFGRGEGCALVVLKPLAAAMRDGDRVWAVIRGSAVNHDGHSSSLTAPNPVAQTAVIRNALRDARVSPDDVQYVEAHGTGTLLGDPIEVEGMTAALREHGGRPLQIGSVKTNIGHLEPAAGIAGLVKTVLALHHRELPPSLHFGQPNPHIPWARIPIRVQSERGPWPEPSRPLRAGVSSFGLTGTNAHVVLEQPPAPTAIDRAAAREPTPLLLPLSARTAAALRAHATRVADWLEAPDRTAADADVAYTAGCRRTHLEHRLAVVGRTAGEWTGKLRQLARGIDRDDEATPVRGGSSIVAVFCGQGPQWWAMGRQLFESEPVFRAALQRCADLVDRTTSWRLLEELGRDQATSRIDTTEIAQPALFALQVALFEQLRAWGVVPDVVVGHSVGEIAAAHAAGALTLEAAAELVVERARIMHRATGRGKMASVELTLDELEAFIADFPGIEIGVDNGPRHKVISGPTDALELALQSLTARGVACKLLRVDYPSHTALIAPLGDELTHALRDWQAGTPTIRMVSTMTGSTIGAGDLDRAYWGQQVGRRVRFHEVCRSLIAEGHDLFVEVGPHPVLLPGLSDIADEAGGRATLIETLRRDTDEPAVLRAVLGRLFRAGYPVDWERQYPVRGRVISLPGYPWQRERYWREPTGVPGIAPDRGGAPAEALQTGRAFAPPAAQELLQALVDQPERRDELVAALEQIARQIVAPILEVMETQIDRDTSLVGLGLDSLRMLAIRRRLARELGFTLPASFDTCGEIVALATEQEPRQRGLVLVPSAATSSLATMGQLFFWPPPDSSPGDYNIVMRVDLDGALDPEAFNRGFEATVARHGIFRTTYRHVNGELHQFVATGDDIRAAAVEHRDLSSLPASEHEHELGAVAERLRGHRFDLASESSLRACLVRRGPNQHTLVVVVHHIAADADSCFALAEEVAAAYDRPASPDLATRLQYVDYADAVVQWGQTPHGRARRHQWQQMLQDGVALDTVTDFPREPVDARRDATPYGLAYDPLHLGVSTMIAGPPYEAVLRLGRDEGATPQMVFLAAYALLFHQRSGQQDICIATLYNDRADYPELADVQGSFVKALIAHIDASARPGLRELAQRTRRAVAAARDNVLAASFDLAPHPLRRAFFNYYPVPTVGRAPIALRDEISATATLVRRSDLERPYDLQLLVEDRGSSARVSFTCNQRLFKRETAQALLQQYISAFHPSGQTGQSI